MADLIYELSFKGTASAALASAFEEYDVTAGHGVTVVRAVLPDQAALQGLIDRINALGLELLDVHLAVGGSRGGDGSGAMEP